jgi:predicted TIM-barrel fold metal-dependent hydrolase
MGARAAKLRSARENVSPDATFGRHRAIGGDASRAVADFVASRENEEAKGATPPTQTPQNSAAVALHRCARERGFVCACLAPRRV